MKKQLLTFLVMLLASISGAWADEVTVPTPYYFNDFSSTDGLTIVGSGEFITESNSHFGQIYHNDPNLTKSVRTNYLQLPATGVLDGSATSKEMTIGFWVNKKNAEDYFYSPIFGAYGAAPDASTGNTFPMLVLEARGLIQLNCSGYCDFGINDATAGSSYNKLTPYVNTAWTDDAAWHYYTVVFTTTTAKVYIDGELKNDWEVDGTSGGQTISGLFSNGGDLKYICLGGNQAWAWNDPDPAFGFDDFAVYSSALSADQIKKIMSDKTATEPQEGVTTLYERGYNTTWSAADIATTGNYVWGGNAYIDGTLNFPYVSGNGGRTSSMTMAPTANSILTVDAVWFTGGDGSNATNYPYFRIGNNLEFQAHTTNQVGNVVINGTSYVIPNACKKDINRTDDYWTIHAVINTATNELTALTVNGQNGTTKASYTLDATKSLGSATYTSCTFGTYREKYSPYCGLKSLKIAEEQQAVTTADYTINYKNGETVVKTVSSSTTIGATVTADRVVYDAENVKYLTDDAELPSMTIVEGTNELNVNVHTPKTATLKVTTKVGDDEATTVETPLTEADDLSCNWSYAFPLYAKNAAGVYYKTDATAFGEAGTFTDGETIEKTVTYTTEASDVYYFAEGESSTAVAGTNYAYSNGQEGYVGGQMAKNRGLNVGTLAAGNYQFVVNATGKNGRYVVLRSGTNEPFASIFQAKTDATGLKTVDFTLDAETSDIWLNGANSSTEGRTNQSENFDYVLIKKAPNKYNWTATAKAGETTIGSLGSGTYTEGSEAVTVAYPRYINVDGTLYEKGANSQTYSLSFTPDKDNYEYVAEYTTTDINNVVYFAEAEKIEGATATAAGKNMAGSSSNAQCAYATSDVTLANLEAGKYTATVVQYSNPSAGLTLKFQAGATEYSTVTEGSSNWDEKTFDFTLASASDVKWLTSGDSKNGLDFIYIVKTGEVGDAEVNGTYYKTLAEAVAAAQAGETVTLQRNVSLTSTISNAKNLTLDLNGKDITATSTRAIHQQEGTLTITGTGTISATHVDGDSFDSSSSVIRVGDNNGTAAGLVLGENVTVSAPWSYGITYFGKDAQTVEINGKVEATGEATAMSGNGTSTFGEATVTVNGTVTSVNDYAIYKPEAGTLTINGTVTGKGGVEIKAGSLVVNSGATVKATASEQTHNAYSNGCSTSGYAIAEVFNPAYKGVGTITVDAGATIDGKTAYGKDKINDYEAQIGGTNYPTLAEAVNAVTEGQTVKLLADVTLDARVDAAVDATYTVDLNGKTITPTRTCGNGSAFNVKAGEVTFKNGTIDGTALTQTEADAKAYNNECDAITVRSGAVANLAEGLVIKINNITGACAYAFSGGYVNVWAGTYSNTSTATGPDNEKAMCLNQANVSTQLIWVSGGTFIGADPMLGDNSSKGCKNFCATDYASTKNADGSFTVALNTQPKAEVASDVKVNGQEASTEQKTALEEVVNNTSVTEAVNSVAESVKSDAIPAGAKAYVQTTMTAASTETTAGTTSITKMTFDVKPVYVESGKTETNVIANENITSAVTFRLPVPSATTLAYIQVNHKAEGATKANALGVFEVKGNANEGGKYIEVSVTSFSEFEEVLSTEMTETRTTEAGHYGTICLPYNATSTGVVLMRCAGAVKTGDVVTGIKFNYVAADGETASETEVENSNLKAGVPYLYRATGNGGVSFKCAAGASGVEATAEKNFVGTYTQKELAVNEYFLYSKTDNNGGDDKIHPAGIMAGETTTLVNVAPYRCYFTALPTEVSTAKGVVFGIFTDDATGLNAVNFNDVKPAEGKFFQNGQIVIVKNGKKYNAAGQNIK